MKKFQIISILLLALNFSMAQNVAEEDAIKDVIQRAYIDGIHNLGEIEDIKNGFHPGFELLIKNQNGQLVKLPIYSWLETIENRKAENPDGTEIKTIADYLSFDVTGEAAVAKFDLYKDGKRTFTDYLFLYKFGNDWKIVSKIYQAY